MDYIKGLIGLMNSEEDQELCKALLNILLKNDGEILLKLYLDLIKDDLNFLESDEYNLDCKNIEKKEDNIHIYNLLKEKGPMTAAEIANYPDVNLSSALKRYRTHMSGRLNDLVKMGYLAKKRRDGKKQYFLTPEYAVKSAIKELGLEYDDIYTPLNLMKLAGETNIPYKHLIRVVKEIKND